MREKTRSMVLAAVLAALTAVGAFLRIPLGTMSLTLQFMFTALAGVVLGPKWGAVSQTVYVALGLLGLPIFTQGGGLGYLLQPSFGFLLGLIPAAAVIGALVGRRSEPRRVVSACLIGLVVLYLVGLPYMGAVLNLYLDKGLSLGTILQTGMLVYLPGDLLKIAAVAVIAPPLCRAVWRA